MVVQAVTGIKKYYQIQEVAEMTGASQRHIRWICKAYGIVPKQRIRKSPYRFTIDQIRHISKCIKYDEYKKADLVKEIVKLNNKLDEVVSHISGF